MFFWLSLTALDTLANCIFFICGWEGFTVFYKVDIVFICSGDSFMWLGEFDSSLKRLFEVTVVHVNLHANGN